MYIRNKTCTHDCGACWTFPEDMLSLKEINRSRPVTRWIFMADTSLLSAFSEFLRSSITYFNCLVCMSDSFLNRGN